MAKREPFALVYGNEVQRHLLAIEPKYHSLIRSQVDAQLRFEPATETRNRKPLRRPLVPGAGWEPRLGPQNRFRVFYEVDADTHTVRVLAVGVKDRNRLRIGDEEFGK